MNPSRGRKRRPVTSIRLSRKESRECTIERLLTTAAKLFVERGFSGTAIDEIAVASGYSRGAFYANFASKEELLLALLKRNLEASTIEIEKRLSSSSVDAPVAERLKNIRSFLIGEMGKKDLYILFLEFKLAALRDHRLRKKWIRLHLEYRLRIQVVLGEALLGLKRTPAMSAQAMTTCLGALLEGLNIQRATVPDSLSEAEAKEYVGLIWDRVIEN